MSHGGKEETPGEFRNVFAAWKKRDSTGGSNADIVRIGSGRSSSGTGRANPISKVGSTFRSGAKKFGDGAKKLTSVVDDGAKKLTSVVDDGAKKLTDTTKKVAGTTVKLTTDGAKKLTSVVTGHHHNNSKKTYEESEEIVFEPVEKNIQTKGVPALSDDNDTDNDTAQSGFAPISNQSQADVQAKIAARYRTQPTNEMKQTKPERKRSVVDRYMPQGDKPTTPTPTPTPTIATIPPPQAEATIPPPPPSTSTSDDKKTPQGQTKQPVLVLSPQMTAKLQASAMAGKIGNGAKGKAALSPTLTKPRGSLQDRIKLFSSSNASAPSWALNAQKKRTDHLQLPPSQERQKKQEEKSKWRHEMRKQRQPNKSVVPARMKNVTAAPMQLTNFEPPKFPKSALDVETITGSIRSNFLFEHLSKADLDTLVQAFEKVRVHVGDEIIKQGEDGDYFYIIGKGQVNFLVNDKVVGSAGGGKSFGELALLYTSPRAATVISNSNPTHLYRVDQKSFRYIMQTKAQESEGEKMKLLQSIKFLKDFDKPDLERLCNCMVMRKFKVNEFIVTKGEVGNHFYIIRDGSVKITEIEAGGKKFDDVTLQPGGYFGERALITSEPRAANVIGKSAGSCFVIDRDTFEKVLGKFSKVISKSQDKVLLEGIHILKEAKLEAKVMDKLSFAIVDRHFVAGQKIMEAEKDTIAALYLVREGSVSIRNGNTVEKTIEAGGYFADEHLVGDALHIADTMGNMPSQLTVVCEEKCTCGVLTLKQCRLFVDTSKAFSIANVSSKKNRASSEGGQRKGRNNNDVSGDFDNNRSSAILQRRSTIKETFNNSVSMEQLERDELLGEGQFGQVWLVKADIWGTGEEEDMEQFALKIQQWDDGDCSKVYEKAIQREKEVISTLEHPFIVDLICSFDNEEESLMLMTVVEGGELWNVIHREKDDGSGDWVSGISESDARFYSFVVGEALAYMHHKSIVFRDLKPENILIDKDGYPNIIDFGFAKVCEGKTFTFCGTPQYVAPEIILSKGHSFGVDHFALGILIYEMIVGENPFYYDGLPTSELYEIITKEEPYPLADTVSKEVKDIITGLLTKDPNSRLGNLSGGELDILNHKWYAKSNLDLKLLKEKKIKAPFIPDLSKE
eukprot:CAMPEP_0113630432 /NCGR_PEP_ID=MMETSP0017_2-20120614/15810_1 /TAXON_ID=2856 /ORGANISM="Cylindrotheca closterium" /LENGTH=1129 /DNA_ID=CAMNT_0000540893 /DNA_START=45 /DNA_END=3434 /DNA_ORIENTATION=+ /assembly_acc=CAM_ASM_000147